MAAGEESAPRVEDDPSTASDALSLHTIAEADAYVSQEQEDADFALALALEEEESRQYARTQTILRGEDPNQINVSVPAPASTSEPASEQIEPPPPYRDDPEADEEQDGNLPPYRDDPDAVPVEGDAEEAATQPAKRQRAFVRILRALFKTWLCCFLISTITTIVIIVVIFVLVFVYGTKVDTSREGSKQAAWLTSGSSDYNLKLPKLYPVLESGTRDSCQNAWNNHGLGVSCHRMILSSAWDNGDSMEVNAEGADPSYYSNAVCTPQCRTSLLRLARSSSAACINRTDRFDFATYGNNGKAYLEKGKIEEGPVHVAKNLLERYERLCTKPTWRQGNTEWGTCAADLWMRWGIVDGKKEAHLNGLENFMEGTSRKRTVPSGVGEVERLSPEGLNVTHRIMVPDRTFGPGDGETDCGFCTVNWLERKMRSFDFGQILDPATGEEMGLSEFRQKLESAMRRCSDREARRASVRVYQKWNDLGWWCDGKPCLEDKPKMSEEAMAILHGFGKDHPTFVKMREEMEKKDAPKKAFQVLYDGVMDMPCGIGFNEIDVMHQIIPHEHIVTRLCSDECRNALDRLNAQHGALFASMSNHPKYGHMFQYPSGIAKSVEKVCLSSTPGHILQSPENLCAPGYAALGAPEWIFASKEWWMDAPIRPQILAYFSRAIDELDTKLQRSKPGPPRQTDPDSMRTQSKILAESVCNTCAGGLFIGKEPDWKKTVDEFLGDKDVNGTQYVAVAKKGWLTCGKMYGMTFTEGQKRAMWKKYGLDRFD